MMSWQVIIVVTNEQISSIYQFEKNRICSLSNESEFGQYLWNYYQFVSWAKWYPDLYIQLFKSKDSNMQLHFDQRVFMRCDVRFQSMYGTFSRGYAKTYTEILDDFIVGTLTPNITLAITAQTKENAAALLEEKTDEILTHYPLLLNEIEIKRFSKNDALVKFKNGASITNLANAQTSKGRRKHRIKIEESALLNNTLYEDALEPITEVPRTTCGNLAIVDPEEMNYQIHFFTTSGYRGSDEYARSVRMINGMRDCSGDIVLGSSWMLPCYYGRGSTKSQILKKKKRSNPIFFAQNYEQKWVGCSDGALVDINKLMACRVLEKPITEIQDNSDEFYIGVDVARSENTSNNQSAISVIKVVRNPKTKRIIDIQVVNVLGMSNKLNFTEQACIVKKYKKAYKAKMVVADGNGLGSGLVDELLKPSYDKITGEYLGCFDTINTDNQPQSSDAEKCLFDMKAQTFQTKVISHFINTVDNGMLKMLIRKQEQDFNDKEREFFDKNIAPFIHSELLFVEISNLKLKANGKNLSVEKVVRKIDKDRFSATAYAIFYVMEYCNKDTEEEKYDYSSAPCCASAVDF
uniref:Terminase large subunit n=1 Tax=Siphoviridae sp. ctZd434 TaxID=2825559 RepID=A0A8S5UHF9_9CAUD|nr:MAG TPA: Terminase large subunit [Siphoviridae sp. ctZd434]